VTSSSAYTIVERPDLRVLRDPFSAKPHVLFYATKRVGGGVTDMAAIEGRIAKALIRRRFRWTLEDWRDPSEVPLPIAPVSAVVSVKLVDEVGGETVLPGTSWRLVSDLHRPKLAGNGSVLPPVPSDGQAVIEFDAGFGPAWGDVPADLQQAVLLLAAEYYEHRHDDGSAGAGLPFGVVTLLERWRQIRILGGKGRT
jgi:uncharacterized phiE125 gp8 family phage protein